MVRPYSLDLRERVISALETGDSCRAVASRFDLAVSTVVKWGQRYRKTGSVAPGKYGGHKRHSLEPHRALVHRLVAARPDQPVRELREALAEHGIELNAESIRRFLHAEGLSFKKSAFALEQDRPEITRRRARWRRHQRSIDPGRLVFVDETWTKTNMAPLRGWSGRGKRLIGKAPHGRWHTYTFLAALRSDRVDAPCLFDGPINGERFRAWVEQALVPTLQPGDVVILDNLGSHKGKAVRSAIRNVDAHMLFLPAYSPDLNPIEQLFAKLKHWLRRQQARNYDTLCNAIAHILEAITPRECANYIQNTGYASIK